MTIAKATAQARSTQRKKPTPTEKLGEGRKIIVPQMITIRGGVLSKPKKREALPNLRRKAGKKNSNDYAAKDTNTIKEFERR